VLALGLEQLRESTDDRDRRLAQMIDANAELSHRLDELERRIDRDTNSPGALGRLLGGSGTNIGLFGADDPLLSDNISRILGGANLTTSRLVEEALYRNETDEFLRARGLGEADLSREPSESQPKDKKEG